MALTKHLTKSIITEVNRNIFTEKPIDDIKNIPQTGKILLKSDKAKLGFVTKKNGDFKHYIKAYFSPWHKSIIKGLKTQLLKAFDSSKQKYAENFSMLPESYYKGLLRNANFERLGSLKQKALTINNCSLRNMPTLRPAYYNPHQAGKGYPFDTIQENLLHIGEPILISHYTRDNKFALVETNAQSHGFVSVQDIALVSDNDAHKMQQQKFGMVVKEHLNLYDNDIDSVPKFIQTVYFSTLLPISQKQGSLLQIYLPSKDYNGFLKLKVMNVHDSDIILNPLVFNYNNAARVIDMLINLPYGWGGYLMNRDCAQVLKDYFAVFGIHIPIFSGNQIKEGNYISLEELNSKQKLEKIKNKAIPLQTILYRKGHVTLYLGEYQKKPIMFHAVWGVQLYDKSDNEYRHIIGKSVITTLEYAKELPGFEPNRSSFLELLSAMAIFEAPFND